MNQWPANISKKVAQCVGYEVPIVVSFPSEGHVKNGGGYNKDDDSFSLLVRSFFIDGRVRSINYC